jgi:predicted short-subunit dehydrogenase-like oxidoreductase (DUF2520 family)
MKEIRSISLVGFGLVGQTLATYLHSRGVNLRQVLVRQVPADSDLQIDFITAISELKPVDLLLVCVNDDALVEVIKQIPQSQFVAHTSGSIGLEQMGNLAHVAVFYPLQSFAHLRAEAVPQIPILIEAASDEQLGALKNFALKYFEHCSELNSDLRAKLHLAAVFANNFTNHLIHLAQKQCEENNLPFELLKPLIAETAQKWMYKDALHLQTGPAVRGDQKVLDKHLAQLSGDMQFIYKTLTQSIQKENKSE